MFPIRLVTIMPGLATLLAFACAWQPAPGVAGEAEAYSAERAGAAIAELAADDFFVRERAAQRLEAWVRQGPDNRENIAGLCRQALQSPEAGLEVRARLESLLQRLPDAAPTSTDVPDAEIARWVDSLSADAFAARAAAADRLRRLIQQPGDVVRVMVELKARLASPSLAPFERKPIQTLWEEARCAWLQSDSATWGLPEVPTETMSQWLDVFQAGAGDSPSAADFVRWSAAERELFDLLARDEYVEPVKEQLRQRLTKGNLDAQATARLEALLEWTLPAMVAEIWLNRSHGTIQHLLVDRPAQPDFAARETWFDRIDDRTAHCRSGNTLVPGDYPVGIMFSFDGRSEFMQFYLVNTPTPRRRLAYECYVKTSEAKRLAAVSQRTVDYYLERGRPLDDYEFITLGALDASAVSRFAGPYFMKVEDSPSRAITNHARVCEVLAVNGCFEALPGLLEADRAKRFLETANSTTNHPWLAILAICGRDPWPGCNELLMQSLDRTDSLRQTGKGEMAEVGATAAAYLLLRSDVDPSGFGLAPVEDELLGELGVVAYRFTSSHGREAVGRWVESQRRQSAP